MKTEQQIREMFRKIRDAKESGQINSPRATAQVLILAWALEILPPSANKFQERSVDPDVTDFEMESLTKAAQEEIRELEHMVKAV